MNIDVVSLILGFAIGVLAYSPILDALKKRRKRKSLAIVSFDSVSKMLEMLERNNRFEDAAFVALAIEEYKESGKWPKGFAKETKTSFRERIEFTSKGKIKRIQEPFLDLK